MSLAGFGGGHPFDLFVEEDGLDAGGGEGEVDGRLELFDPMASALEVVDHFAVADFAAADVEGGLQGAGHAGEEGEGDGEEEDEEADAGGSGLIDDGVMIAFGVDDVAEFVDKGAENDEDGSPCGEGSNAAETLGEGGGLGEFGLEVVELVVDAILQVAHFEGVELPGWGRFAEEGESGGEGEAVPVRWVVFALGVEWVENAGSGFDATEELGGKAAMEPGALGAAVVMPEHEAEGAGDEEEFDACEGGDDGESVVGKVFLDILLKGNRRPSDDRGHSV